jgi:hypothetical protein
MATPAKVKWTIEADYLQACNCDYGCPCEFEAPPTKGFCEGVGAWRINRGSYGNVSLNGLGLGFALRSPAALHLGNITLALFVDQRANQQQRDSLVQIASGQAGGMPFEIIASLVSKLSGPHFVPIQFNVQGKNSSAKIGNVASMGFEPIKNPVTGQPESIRIEHETGFLFKGADVVSAKECRSSVADLNFSWPDKAGFVTQVKYGN